MPTYDYKCKECDHLFEYFQAMSDELLKSCPKCNGQVRRLISGGSGLIFKGSGFYVTDYVKKKPPSSDKKPDKKQKTEKKTTTSKGKNNDKG